jgi:2-methylcitrate dehydratase PrpD
MTPVLSKRHREGWRMKSIHDLREELTRKDFFRVIACGAAGSAVAAAAGGCNRSDLEAGALQSPANPRKRTKAELKGTTDAIVQFITTAKLERFPADVIAQGKRCLIDGFGVILAGSTVHGSAIVRQYVKSITDKRGASILGPERMTAPAPQAALANGASGHALDYDDTQLSTTPDRTFGLLTHPTVPALASALAVAEEKGASGADFLEAFLTGFEVECKVAEAIDPDHYVRGFHSTGTAGTFGAMACAARLLKLDAEATAHAVGIAAGTAAGIRVNFGTMTKPLHAGRAAENGVFAATLAARGFTSGDDALDGQWGYFQVLGGGAEPDRLVGVLGRPYAIINPGVSVKPYPCGSLSHPSMDAMLKLVTDHDVKPEQIKAVRLRAGTNILEPLRYKTAKTELEAKFCVPFLLGVIALRRKAGIAEFQDEFIASEPMQRMMERVTTVFDPQIEARGFDKIRSVVEVDLQDGRTLVQPSDERYRGAPDWPFTRAELHDRFADCAAPVLASGRIRRALEQIEAVDTLKSIRELTQTLTGSA